MTEPVLADKCNVSFSSSKWKTKIISNNTNHLAVFSWFLVVKTVKHQKTYFTKISVTPNQRRVDRVVTKTDVPGKWHRSSSFRWRAIFKQYRGNFSTRPAYNINTFLTYSEAVFTMNFDKTTGGPTVTDPDSRNRV